MTLTVRRYFLYPWRPCWARYTRPAHAATCRDLPAELRAQGVAMSAPQLMTAGGIVDGQR